MKKKLLLIAITIAFLAAPKFNFGQAPTLGTAASFIAFTADGAVVNTGSMDFLHLRGHCN